VQSRPLSLFVALLLGASPAWALDPRQSFDQYVQRRWTSGEGLPQNAVLAIAQTKDGYLWLGTQEGLVRFDGVSFHTFDRQNTAELKSNFVTTLHPDTSGGLWIGTGGGGLSHYSEGVFHTYRAAEGLAHDIVTALTVDASGGVWAGTREGLTHLSGDRFTTFRTQEGLASNVITALSSSADGSLWVATEGGISRLKEGRWTSFSAEQGLPSGKPQSILQDRAGRIWVGTDDGTLVRFEQGRFTQYRRAEGLMGERISSLLEDREGNLWVGTSAGLHRLAGERLEAMTPSSGPVPTLFEDMEGNLWVGTDGGGVLQLRSARLWVVTARQGLPKDNVLTLHEDAQGALWVGTYGGGVARLEGNTVTGTWSTRNGLPSDDVTALHSTREGILWAGLMKRGLARIEGGRVRTDGIPTALMEVSILALLVDRTGRLWIGTLDQGLYCLEGGRLLHYAEAEGLADNTVYALKESEDGSLWIGTRRGMSHLRAGQLVRDASTQVLEGLTILSIHEDAQGALWVGTYAQGLHWVYEGRHFAFGARQGLFNEVVFHILEDDSGVLWMSCNKGLFSVSKADLQAVMAGQASRVTNTLYGKGDGISTAEGNGGSQPGAWKARDGRLWFPTVGGAVAIDPRGVRQSRNLLPPFVHIEQVSGDGNSIETREPARVPPGRGRLEFRYVGVSFVSPEKVTFKYRLDGFDTEWTEAGTQRSAHYTNLPPGEYRFRVMAANSDGVWSEDGASVAVELEAHFYQTRGFQALLVLLALSLGWGLHRLRIQQLQARSLVLEERNRLAREIHDGLTQSLTGVLIQIDVALGSLEESPRTAQEHLERARGWAQHSLNEARRAIWALRPSVASVSALTERLRRCAVLLSPSDEVLVEVRSSEDKSLSPHVGATLLRIGQEAITNALRHGRPRHLRIDVQCMPREVRLRLGDDGRGFDVQGALRMEGGQGLVSMRERAESLGGHLIVASTPGQGTEVTAVLPLSSRGLEREHGD
jgi:ligand-binding sensor domain-containing protein/signal transduction histidine kinase